MKTTRDRTEIESLMREEQSRAPAGLAASISDESSTAAG